MNNYQTLEGRITIPQDEFKESIYKLLLHTTLYKNHLADKEDCKHESICLELEKKDMRALRLAAGHRCRRKWGILLKDGKW